jgi:hypothetical protein
MEPEPVSVFRPEFAVLAAVALSLLLAVLFIANAGTANAAPQAGLDPSTQAGGGAPQSSNQAPTVPSRGSLGKATLDLGQLTKTDNIDESDNVRWSLVRGTPAGLPLYNASSGVNWKALRQVTQAGQIPLAAGATWSFNQAYQEGTGYKNASGVLAGGQCALATVFRVAADRAGLATAAKPHKYPIPGFALAETVNIWWGRDDLRIQNNTKQAVVLAWLLTPQGVTVSVLPQAASN